MTACPQILSCRSTVNSRPHRRHALPCPSAVCAGSASRSQDDWACAPKGARVSRHVDIRVRRGRNLRRLQTEKGLSQEAFAFEADIHRTYIRGIERAPEIQPSPSCRSSPTHLACRRRRCLDDRAEANVFCQPFGYSSLKRHIHSRNGNPVCKLPAGPGCPQNSPRLLLNFADQGTTN